MTAINWNLFFKYFALVPLILGAIESIVAAIQAGQAASTPPLNTYIASHHGAITISWQPLP